MNSKSWEFDKVLILHSINTSVFQLNKLALQYNQLVVTTEVESLFQISLRQMNEPIASEAFAKVRLETNLVKDYQRLSIFNGYFFALFI